ncbi:MAG TPA: hypothetical protein VGG03_03555 [Thermoanaerobaculia bacterium]|jgi:hypothetical protein
MKKTASPLAKLCKLALVLTVFLVPAVLQQQASASTSPCRQGCGYKWNPVTRCCEPDPRFDCPEICF